MTLSLRSLTAAVVGSLVLVVAVFLAFTVHSGPSDTIDTSGPLKQPNSTVYIERLTPNTQFADAFVVLELTGSQPATILSVKSFTSGEAFRYLGSYVAGADREYGEDTSDPRWPPSERVFGNAQPAAGFTVLPESETPPRARGFELLLGYSIVGTQLSYRTRIEVNYKVGNATYRLNIPSAIVGCPLGDSLHQCEGFISADMTVDG